MTNVDENERPDFIKLDLIVDKFKKEADLKSDTVLSEDPNQGIPTIKIPYIESHLPLVEQRARDFGP